MDQYTYDPLGNISSSTVGVSNPFTFQGWMYDSSTGFYYTGSGYYDPATGQSFGCKDKGPADTPGQEDYCGEDEPPNDDTWTGRTPVKATSWVLGKPHPVSGEWLTLRIRWKSAHSNDLVLTATLSGPATKRYTWNIILYIAGPGLARCDSPQYNHVPSLSCIRSASGVTRVYAGAAPIGCPSGGSVGGVGPPDAPGSGGETGSAANATCMGTAQFYIQFRS